MNHWRYDEVRGLLWGVGQLICFLNHGLSDDVPDLVWGIGQEALAFLGNHWLFDKVPDLEYFSYAITNCAVAYNIREYSSRGRALAQHAGGIGISWGSSAVLMKYLVMME